VTVTGAWIALIEQLHPERELRPGATEAQLAEAEASLGLAIPRELRGLLEDTNGAFGEYGLALIWSVDRIARDNLQFRSLPAFRQQEPDVVGELVRTGSQMEPEEMVVDDPLREVEPTPAHEDAADEQGDARAVSRVMALSRSAAHRFAR
jgi:hypothetical protein